MSASNNKKSVRVVLREDAKEPETDFNQRTEQFYDIADSNQESVKQEEAPQTYKVVDPNSLKTIFFFLGLLTCLSPLFAW